MMKKVNTIYHFRSLRGRFFVAILALVALLLGATQVEAQNVTIRPDNGNLIVGQAGGQSTESGIRRGLYAMWRHEQLALTMTTSDLGLQTSAGELGDPSCGIGKYNGKLILAAGQTQTFVVVSLPKGYRITSYRLVLQPNLLGQNVRGEHATEDFVLYHSSGNTQNNSNNKGAMAFYETPAWNSASPYGENTHDLGLDCPDAIVTATAEGGDQEMNPQTDADKEFVIERTAQSADDMSNQLHFFFARSCSQYGVTIKSFEIWFNAQGTFDAEVEPVRTGLATDYVQSPFTTGKMDVGSIKKNNNGIYTYDYTKVRDLIAYTHLYQSNTVAEGVGKPVSVGDGEKNIHPVQIDGKDVYAFGNDTYFIESPTEINTVSGASGQPIGFRIVGAKFDYNWGKQTDPTTKTIPTSCHITVKGSTGQNGYPTHPNSLSDNGNTTFYLNSDLMFTTEEFLWEMDDVGNIGIGLNSAFPQYLACFGEGESRQLSLSSSANGSEARWNLRRAEDGSLHYYSDGTNGVTNDYRLYARRFQEGTPYHTRGIVTRTGQLPTGTNGGAVWVSCIKETDKEVTIPGFTPGTYTLKIYGTDKTTPVKTVTVSGASSAGSYTVDGLNNDAVKFEISELPNGTLAQVTVTLQMEALSPYIDKMDIVCHDEVNTATGKPNLELTQTFTASDFSVSGGKFIFYVPSDYSDELLTFTFSNLYSKYGDNTYYTGLPEEKNGNSRYSYVTSDYFEDFDGNGDGGLYDANYSPISDYMDKVFTSTAGNVRFKFNNAEDLGKPVEQGGKEFLIEDAFSVEKYLSGYDDPDGSDETGAFISCQLTANPNAFPTGTDYKKSDIFYVFTADETRYNIAPTTEWQHRSYAFYRMDIELEARTFTPKFTYEKVYDKTFQLRKQPVLDDEGHEVLDDDGKVKYEEVETEDSMWGLILDAEEEFDDVTGEKIIGYFTYQEVINHIQATLGDNVDAPARMDQILYVDGTRLSALLNSSENSVIKRLQDLKELLAVNNLVFLPKNTTSTLDNAAFMTASGSFRAGNRILLTDKQPFYSPYDIQVDTENEATYTRMVSDAANGQADNATIIVPFALTLDADGIHTNPDGSSSFTVYTMNSGEEMKLVNGSSVDYGTKYFKKLEDETTVANKPYMVKVGDRGNVSGSENFVVAQKAALIKATPTGAKNLRKKETGDTGNDADYLGLGTGTVHIGESATATYNTTEYNFTNVATYSGAKFDRAKSEKVFYFANNKYLDLHTLYVDPNNKGKWRYLYVYPFRNVFTYTGGGSGAKMMKWFDISFDEPNNSGIVTDVENITKADLMVKVGKGVVTLSATRSQDVNINTLSGMNMKRVALEAGNTQNVALPSGVYLINNVKVIVK